MYSRRLTRKIKIGNVPVGGGAAVSVQSMCNTRTDDVQSTLAQLNELAKAGCEIGRLAVPDMRAAEALPQILEKTPMPLVADIHFDYRLALAAIKAGIHAVRINPGNIGSDDRVKMVAEAAGEAGIAIRCGANSGSLPAGLYDSFLHQGLAPREAMAEALAEAALRQAAMLERFGFKNIKVSLKSSSVISTVEACRKFSQRSDIPLHIGVTESGIPANGIIKSAVGIGTLLMEGIGDTLRVSLTAPPAQEVYAAIKILEAAGLRSEAPELVSCPTCGRTKINLEKIAAEVDKIVCSVKAENKKIGLKKIAVMGCVVNGPGEASDADIGIAGGDGVCMIFKFGKSVAVMSESDALAFLEKEIRSSAK